MSFPVRHCMADALGCSPLPCRDVKRARQLVGNCMAFSNVALVLMVFLSSFRPLIGADESCNAQPSNDGGDDSNPTSQ